MNNPDSAENTARPFYSSEPRPRGILATGYSEEGQRIIRQSVDFPFGMLSIAHEPVLLLNHSLVVYGANQSFLEHFGLTEGEILGCSLSWIGNGGWNIPVLLDALRQMPLNSTLQHFAVDNNATATAQRRFYINAYCFDWERIHSPAILLCVKDDVEQRLSQQAKEEFFGLVSHELRTPVTSIKAYTEILTEMLNERKGDDALGLITKMEKQVDRLTKLISYLLDVNQLIHGELGFARDIFPFNDLVDEVCHQLDQNSSRSPIVKDLQGNPVIMGDRKRLGQVLSNLLSNAVKFSPPVTEVRLQTEITDQRLVVKVVDRGIGIPADEQQDIFNRFFRTRETNSTYPGLGVGLYLASQIIKYHGGTIGVESAPGNGSVFCFSLPLIESKQK